MTYPILLRAPGMRAFAEVVDDERTRQLQIWGDQHRDNGTGYLGLAAAAQARMECQQAQAAGSATWRHVLAEEVAEAFAESDPARLRRELTQAAAVIAAWLHDLDRDAR